MMIFNWVKNLFVGNLVKGVDDIVKTVAGSRLQRDISDAAHQSQFLDRVAEEVRQRARHRTWWDILIDGVNRLVRPLYTYGVLAMMLTAFLNPGFYLRGIETLAVTPQPIWYLIGIIIGFWFTGKFIDAVKKNSPLDMDAVEKISRLRKEHATEEPSDEVSSMKARLRNG